MVSKTVAAWELRPGWIVIPATGFPRRVLSVRLEGARPVAQVEYAGIPHRIAHQAVERLTVEDTQ